MRSNDKLRHARQASEQRWLAFVAAPHAPASHGIISPLMQRLDNPADIEPWLTQSWQMSQNSVSIDKTCAPLGDAHSVRTQFVASHFYQVARPVLAELQHALSDTGFAIGLSDATAQLQWTASSRAMARKLESAHFMPSARWDEASIGTNAVGLAARTGRSVSVFSAQHYVPNLHQWVCYAAPVIHAPTGQIISVLDISAPWQHATPMALATVRHYAAHLSDLWSQVQMHSVAALYLCAHANTAHAGWQLPRRLQEIALVLALHPEGLSLEALHAHVYGDATVSLSTLKSEMSHLRARLGDVLQARPYRLSAPTPITDAQLIETLIQTGRLTEAVQLYQQPVLPHSNSPTIQEYRAYLHCQVMNALIRSSDTDALWQFIQYHEAEFAVLNRLLTLLPAQDARQSALLAKLSQFA